VRVISSTSRRATTRHPGRTPGKVGRRMGRKVRPGCRAVGRCQVEEMTLRSRGGRDQRRPARQQEGITTPGTPRHASVPYITMARPNGTAQRPRARRNRVHTEEVTGSIPVSPTAERPGQWLNTSPPTRPFFVSGAPRHQKGITTPRPVADSPGPGDAAEAGATRVGASPH